MTNLSSFYSGSRYRGNGKPENILFNANLQEFAQKVDFIVGLQTGGKTFTRRILCTNRNLVGKTSREQTTFGN